MKPPKTPLPNTPCDDVGGWFAEPEKTAPAKRKPKR